MREPATLLETSPEARPDFPPQNVILEVFYLLILIVSYKISIYHHLIKMLRTRGEIIDSITLIPYALQTSLVLCRFTVLSC